MGKVSEYEKRRDEKRREEKRRREKRRDEKRYKRKGKRHLKRKHSSSSSSSSSPSSSPSSARLLKASTKRETSKERKERFIVPYQLVCSGCECIVAPDVKVNAVKKLIGKIWNYKFKCPFCRNKIVMERVSGDPDYVVDEGAKFDWNAWKKKHSKACLDNINPSLSDNYNIFDMFDFSIWEVDPRTGKAMRPV